MTAFSYEEFTTRNIGFVTPKEQETLKKGRVFIAGVGGMGGAAFATLVRAGVGHIAIADIDEFEVSNLNRQVSATMETIGMSKVSASVKMAQAINPEISLSTFAGEWVSKLDEITKDYAVIINGTDDVRATIALYRAAQSAGAVVIDAYASSLPSVFVVRPEAPRPEIRLNYPTPPYALSDISDEMVAECVVKELEYVLTNSSSINYVETDIAADFAAGKRSRFSFAPMVLTTGNMMAYEAVALLLGKESQTDDRGYFFNPHRARTERPAFQPYALVKGFVVRQFLKKMMDA